MRFSYTVKQQVLLQDIALTLTPGKAYLITGMENINLGILAGILAKLLPVRANIEIPQIKALIENYTGKLVIEGELPHTVAYVGVDPDRHLLFSTVEEEMLAQLGKINFVEHLAAFGLHQDFLTRQIATLSGGEKMKLALALAFADQCDCYILHGCIPWLDKIGRETLLTQIVATKKTNASIIIIEHEISALTDITDAMFIFDGQTLQPTEPQKFFAQYFATTNQDKLNHIRTRVPTKTILEFKQLSFGYATKPLLTNASFSLELGKNYLLLGENGAGKSTLAQIIFRVLKPKHGKILLQEKPLAHYSRAALNNIISYVGQFPLQQITLNTVGEYKTQLVRTQNVIALPLLDNYLNLADNFPVSLLSFLQLKILCLISLLTKNTELIILDEPTWGIDHDGKLLLWQLLQDIAKHLNFTLLIITHDLKLIDTFNPEIFWLNAGNILHFKNTHEFKQHPLTQQYFTLTIDADEK